MPNLIDRTGQVFGRLSVVSRGVGPGKKTYWQCLCSCGQTKTVDVDALRDGLTRSCGCLLKEVKRKERTTHGMSQSLTYRSWQDMLVRCSDHRCASYKWYGGKGITVCLRWQMFENFLADMGLRPKGTTLHRLDHGGHYEPGNCEWRQPPH